MVKITNKPSAPPEILLVDDVPLLLHSVGRLLEQKFGVLYANSGREALELLERSPSIKVVISDYNMSAMSGIELFKLVAASRPATARILFTGVPELDIARDAIQETGLHRFLCKPCGFTELLEAAESGVRAHDEFVLEELETEKLVFSYESLAVQNRDLEERIFDQSHSILCLRRLGIDLNRASGLSEIAHIAARTACEALESRGTYAQFSVPDGTFVEASAGPEMSARMVAEPVTTKDGTIGEIIIDVLNARGRSITYGQQNILAAIASTTAVAVHNEVRRQQRDEAQYATVFALARLSERRDEETGRHLERVSEYSRLIAECLVRRGQYADLITPDYLRDLVLSAPLHDIGKVGIPDSILLKKGKLTAGEWEIMKTHAQIGADTLASVLDKNQSQSYLRMGYDIAAGHHEKWDGSGYPVGRKGTEIPLSARILALADVYDALTTVRPYKGAWSHEEACAFILESSGTQFDPDLVQALLASDDEVCEVRRRLADNSSNVGHQLRVLPKIA